MDSLWNKVLRKKGLVEQFNLKDVQSILEAMHTYASVTYDPTNLNIIT